MAEAFEDPPDPVGAAAPPVPAAEAEAETLVPALTVAEAMAEPTEELRAVLFVYRGAQSWMARVWVSG